MQPQGRAVVSRVHPVFGTRGVHGRTPGDTRQRGPSARARWVEIAAKKRGDRPEGAER